ncbi:hypothetical protein SDC9_147212 [bioreactor metagenome]|uniref:Uncharacterized protein n=1 Tax=bioreactor metagenome TaxID=1076179 RepID=A0A645EDF5_9ZZZZ
MLIFVHPIRCKDLLVRKIGFLLFISGSSDQFRQFLDFLQSFLGESEILGNFLRQARLIFQCVGNMQQRAGSADDDVVAVLFQPIDQVDDLFVVALPDIFPVQDAGKQSFISRKAISFQKFHGLFAFDEVKADAVEVEPNHFFVAVPDIPEVGLQQYFYVTLMRQDFFVYGSEQRDIFFGQIGYQARFIELHPRHTLLIEPIEYCDIGICHLVGKIIYCFGAFVFC